MYANLSSLGSSTLMNFSILIWNCFLLRLRTSSTNTVVIMKQITSAETIATAPPIIIVV